MARLFTREYSGLGLFMVGKLLRVTYLPELLCVSGLILLGVAGWGLLGKYKGLPEAPVVTWRIGDAASTVMTEAMDARFPDMAQWAKAGVRGGIPAHIPGHTRVQPGEDIQAAVDRVAAEGGGLVQLVAGTYPLTEALTMRTNVVVTGAGPELTILENRLRTQYPVEREIVGIRFMQIQNSGIQNLTILSPFVRDLDKKIYQNRFEDNMNGINDLQVGHLVMYRAYDCWVDNCRFLYSGSAPIIISYSSYITMRDNVVDTSFNKGGNGSGYYMLLSSRYVLCYNETVRNIRHFVIQNGSGYNVILKGRYEVDVNFHGEDDGHNLIEDCVVELPAKHMWPPVSYWRRPPGPDNLIYRITASKGKSKILEKGVPCDPLAMYTLKDGSPRAYLYEVAQPTPVTLYPMSGRR